MKKTSLYFWIGLVFFTAACSIDNQDDIEDIGEVKTEEFTEGIVEMGMFSQGTDIGHYIKHIDFSRDDTGEQLQALIAEAGAEDNFLSHFQQVGEQNPMAVLALMFNTVIADYYIKGEAVLAKSRGFGFNYDHLHDNRQDVGKIFMETLVSTDEIPEADRKISVDYSPSTQEGTSANTSFDADLFNREILDAKENVLGYACNVSVYTPKPEFVTPDPNNPMSQPMIRKLVVYTSPLFSNTINFTHPFYMPEEGGILRVDMYMENGEQPTLEMRPYTINQQTITDAQLNIERSEPIYQMTDFSWGFKALAIFMSGWGTLGE